jgi:P27 family predicted phage terminase small subunit
MAQPGPPPKPTALKLIAGNPGKKALPEGEPKPKVEVPEAPKHLAPEARAEWERLAPMLVRLKLMTRLDRAAFAAYCQAWSRHVECEEVIAKTGLIVMTPNQFPQIAPYVTISKQAVEQMAKFLGEFGLTPAARTRINAPQPDPEPDGENAAQADKRTFTF